MLVKNSELEINGKIFGTVKKCKSENWHQKLLNRKIGNCKKIIERWKIDKNILSQKIWVKNFYDKKENCVRNFLVGKLALKKYYLYKKFWVWKSVLGKVVKRIDKYWRTDTKWVQPGDEKRN